ncbi:universal stress protein [Streptantibioticus rubrisoli]|uniref:Universal stress protein n=1 Tax=Streptantibioticus rubrisoli TaxID=1387313 RepID=A0ABT1PAC7_9ACTN|nr:universal stress protein [Streptantibioticus rubrisoli]MCQ4042306.1 universal stress protein [Streptantibioticus rubrisoli]
MTTSTWAGDVVVGVDGSDDSDRAVDWAAAEADHRGSALHIVHGVGTAPDPDKETGPLNGDLLTVQAARSMLDEAGERARREHPGLKVTATLAYEEGPQAVLAAAAGAALTVLGTRGRGGFAALLLGSVALRVAAHTTCPLVVVRGERTRPPIGTVVVGVQDEKDAQTVRFAVTTAARWHASVRAVHAWEPLGEVGLMATQVDTVRELRAAHTALLSRTVEAAHLTDPQAQLSQEVVVSRAATALVEASAEADLLVVAAHRPHGPLGLRLGPVVHAVLHHSHCPVAVVPDR